MSLLFYKTVVLTFLRHMVSTWSTESFICRKHRARMIPGNFIPSSSHRFLSLFFPLSSNYPILGLFGSKSAPGFPPNWTLETNHTSPVPSLWWCFLSVVCLWLLWYLEDWVGCWQTSDTCLCLMELSEFLSLQLWTIGHCCINTLVSCFVQAQTRVDRLLLHGGVSVSPEEQDSSGRTSI